MASRRGCTCGTPAVQHDFVRLEKKSRRRQCREMSRASFDLEHLRALPAAEMMMMCGTGALVARRFSRQFDGYKPTIVHERVDGAVYRGHTESRDLRTASREGDLLRRNFRTIVCVSASIAGRR